jgi:hypothetical protein
MWTCVFFNIPIATGTYPQKGAQYTRLHYDYRKFKTSPNVVLLPGALRWAFYFRLSFIFTILFILYFLKIYYRALVFN